MFLFVHSVFGGNEVGSSHTLQRSNGSSRAAIACQLQCRVTCKRLELRGS
jgi:hypothetical protein